jgi:hypothetical protein
MKDDLKIRELYNQILNERALANGSIIKENLNIPVTRTSPDRLEFDGSVLSFDRNARAFAFIGQGSDLIGYINDSGGTHPYIFSAFVELAAALNLTEFPPMLAYRADRYKGTKLKDAKKILKSNDVSYHGNMSEDNLDYFANKQKQGVMTDTRRNTRAGRIWFNVPSKKSGGNTNVVVFWCRQKDVRPEDLQQLKELFKVSEFYWSGTDSSKFNFYNDDYQESSSGKIKELKSKIYPDLKHDQIVDILMRAHTGYKITPFEQKVVWEFRGFDPSELKQVTGGYPTRAEYESKTRFSESFES